MSTDLTPALATISVQAEHWRKLCQRYDLPPNVTANDLEIAILRRGEHTGFAHAIIGMQTALGELAQGEKMAYHNGDGCPTLAD